MQELIRVCVMVELKYISLLRAENERSLVAFIAGKTAAGRYDQFVFTLNQPIKSSTRYFAVCFTVNFTVKDIVCLIIFHILDFESIRFQLIMDRNM